jgi:ribosomal protein L16 Arg81 hydroxylase
MLADDSSETVQEYRPLECVQEAGDTMYLPAGWSHLTVNIGETIGIGGQAALPATQRFFVSEPSFTLGTVS